MARCDNKVVFAIGDVLNNQGQALAIEFRPAALMEA
jgi:hypothetical protein